jgi:hypothetical protein
LFYCLISVSSSSATSIVANGYFYNNKIIYYDWQSSLQFHIKSYCFVGGDSYSADWTILKIQQIGFSV